jgi:hypothetical protein
MDTPNTQIHDRLLSCFGTGISIKSCGVRLVLWDQTSPLYCLFFFYLWILITPLLFLNSF